MSYNISKEIISAENKSDVVNGGDNDNQYALVKENYFEDDMSIKILMGITLFTLIIIFYIIWKLCICNVVVSNINMMPNSKLNNSSNMINENIDGLTRCGWEVYVTSTCPYCIQQQSILSQHCPNFKNIYYDRPTEAVPTWYNTRTQEKRLGMQSRESLINMANC